MIEAVDDGVTDWARRSDASHDLHFIDEVLLATDDRLQGVVDCGQRIGEFPDHGHHSSCFSDVMAFLSLSLAMVTMMGGVGWDLRRE
jgi:hypothetical protein